MNMEISYLDPPCALNPCYGSSFSHALNKRVKISKLISSIGSTNVDGSACQMFHDPLAVPFDALESWLSSVLGDDDVNTIRSTIGAIQDTCGKGVPKDHLSRIWLISQDLVNGAINQTTQPFRHHEDNNLSRHFPPNYCMLRHNSSRVFSSQIGWYYKPPRLLVVNVTRNFMSAIKC